MVLSKQRSSKRGLAFSPRKVISLLYHDLFEYPLTEEDLTKWEAGFLLPLKRNKSGNVLANKGYFFLEGSEGVVDKRLKREEISKRKILIARNIVATISKTPSVKAIGITGSLSMRNSEEGSDIDFIVVTEKGALWITRLLVLLTLDVFGIPRRHAGNKEQKNRVCLNMWMDESDLAWPENDRNFYTAHELLQIEPIFERGEVFRKIYLSNSWVKKYWPNAYKFQLKRSRAESYKATAINNLAKRILLLVEPLARFFQNLYMNTKITNEVISKSRAIFHPRLLGNTVTRKLLDAAS